MDNCYHTYYYKSTIMNNLNYGLICNHSRLVRLDKHFVRCLECGQSIPSQIQIKRNKTVNDFVRENKNFTRNFNRNFSNIIEQEEELSDNIPLYEYYTDRLLANTVVVNRKVKFSSDPPKYEVQVNNVRTYLTNNEIQKILRDINAVRIDEMQMNMIQKRYKLN